MKDKILNILLAVLGVLIALVIVLTILVIGGKIDFDDKLSSYSDEKYYKMLNSVTDDNIKFYIYKDMLYLDNTFDKSVGTIFKEENGSIFILYNNEKYILSDDDLNVISVKKR